jgi:hypothetical protein
MSRAARLRGEHGGDVKLAAAAAVPEDEGARRGEEKGAVATTVVAAPTAHTIAPLSLVGPRVTSAASADASDDRSGGGGGGGGCRETLCLLMMQTDEGDHVTVCPDVLLHIAIPSAGLGAQTAAGSAAGSWLTHTPSSQLGPDLDPPRSLLAGRVRELLGPR